MKRDAGVDFYVGIVALAVGCAASAWAGILAVLGTAAALIGFAMLWRVATS